MRSRKRVSITYAVNMKQSTVIYILTFVQLVYGAGINEVFTWTRISYVRPRQSRYGYGGSHSRPSPGIVFPDDMEKFGDQNDRNEENSNYIYGEFLYL